MNWVMILALIWAMLFWLIVICGWIAFGFSTMFVYACAYILFPSVGIFLLVLRDKDANDEN